MVTKYPGRHRVFHRDSARAVLWEQYLREETGKADPNACERPIVLSAIGLPGMLDADRSRLPVELHGRCRNCRPCLRHRQRLWTARAIDELRWSPRSWFGTLTVAPEHRFRFRMITDLSVQRRRREPLSSLSDAELFKEIAAPLNKEATDFLKRIRSAQPLTRLRYLLVTEKHKSGDPHMHILLHNAGEPIRKAVLEEQWRVGFSHWRLVPAGDDSPAVYACKYLTKDSLTRVRASRRYGQLQKCSPVPKQEQNSESSC